MRDAIVANLSSAIDPSVVEDLVSSYEILVSEYRKGDRAGCLTEAGKFVEHTFRAAEYLRTGTAPKEIKSPAAVVKQLEANTTLPDSLRLLLPRIAYAMIYDIRSKRGAVHVKEINPQHIDAALAVQAASWVIAELIRLYHSSAEENVSEAMANLMRSRIPYIEEFGGEIVVTRDFSCEIELLLLLERAEPFGLNRMALGQQSMYSPASVTKTIQTLCSKSKRYAHRVRSGEYRVTGPGEAYLAAKLTEYRKTPGI